MSDGACCVCGAELMAGAAWASTGAAAARVRPDHPSAMCAPCQSLAAEQRHGPEVVVTADPPRVPPRAIRESVMPAMWRVATQVGDRLIADAAGLCLRRVVSPSADPDPDSEPPTPVQMALWS